MENFDFNDTFVPSNSRDSQESLNNQTFHNISKIEPINDIDIEASLLEEKENQSYAETNFTSMENQIIDIIYEIPVIEMICPHTRKKVIKKSLKYKRKSIRNISNIRNKDKSY